MKKILAAFDGLRFSERTMEEAINLARGHNAQLVGVFLEEFLHTGFKLFEKVETYSYAGGKEMVKRLHQEDKSTLQYAVDLFKNACTEAGIQFSIHLDRDEALEALLQESLFADILLIDRRETFSSLEENSPGWLLRHLLHEIHCPSWIVSQNQGQVRLLTFLYDGEAPSIYAMKMFSYLFPEMGDYEVEVVSYKTERPEFRFQDDKLIVEWMNLYYPQAVYKKIKENNKDLFGLLEERGADRLIVTGASERNRLSKWLIPGLADELIQNSQSPIFMCRRG